MNIPFLQRDAFRHRSGRRRSRLLVTSLTAWLFLVPTFALIIVFSYYPAFSALYHSFTDWNGFAAPRFISFENFEQMTSDRVMLASLRNMLMVSGWSLLVALVPPLVVAELIDSLRSARAQYWYRLLFVVPIVVPLVVTLYVWNFIYDPDIGLVKSIFDAFGWDLQTRMLGDFNNALYFLMAIGFPFASGVNVLIYLAGLQNIDQEVRDSAELDGATAWRRVLYIDLPLLKGQIRLLGILALIGGIQGFQAQYVLTDGGPGYATMVPGMWMYRQGYNYAEMGYASAIGTTMFILILILTIFSMHRFRSQTEYAAE